MKHFAVNEHGYSIMCIDLYKCSYIFSSVLQAIIIFIHFKMCRHFYKVNNNNITAIYLLIWGSYWTISLLKYPKIFLSLDQHIQNSIPTTSVREHSIAWSRHNNRLLIHIDITNKKIAKVHWLYRQMQTYEYAWLSEHQSKALIICVRFFSLSVSIHHFVPIS